MIGTPVSITLSIQVSEVFGVELGEPLAVVDGLADHNHRGEGEVVVMDDACEVFQLTAEDALVGPSKVIAGSHGSVCGVFHKQLALHVINDRSAEENAHGGLALCQQMKLFLFRHRSTTLAASEDDGLAAFRYGELALQLRGGGEERGDTGGDVIVHLVGIEERHLLLDGAEDTRVAGMQADDEVAAVIVLLHQGALFLEIHIGGGTDDGARLVAFCQGFRH